MKEYLDFIRDKGYDDETIEVVKKSILLAEQYISIPKSQKPVAELVNEVNKIYQGD